MPAKPLCQRLKGTEDMFSDRLFKRLKKKWIETRDEIARPVVVKF